MKKVGIVFIVSICLFQNLSGQVGKVGINTTSPAAMLHVKDSSVVFTGQTTLPGTPGNPPVSGSGTRFMWYADKASFRAGHVNSTQWNRSNVGNYSSAAGYNTTASGNYSTSFGNSNTSSGIHSTSFGNFNLAGGSNSFAIGNATEATGNTSFTMGSATKSIGDYATAFGINTTANSYASSVFGRYNDLTSTSGTTWISSDPLFIVGNGSSSGSRSNALTILKNGRTGINTPNPVAHFQVLDGSVVFNSTQQFPSSTNPPISGPGSRMMWHYSKLAFRAGTVDGMHWDYDSIGWLSVAMGQNVVARGYNSFASGRDTRAIEEGAVAMGLGALSSGIYSFALGEYSVASGHGAFSSGYYTRASGFASTAMSHSTQAKGSNSFASGFNTLANGYASTVIGMYNDSIIAPQTGGSTLTTPLFIIGNGSSLNARSNALTVLKNGNIGITTSSPEFKLDITGRMRLRYNGAESAGIWFNKEDNSLISFLGMFNDNHIGIYSGGGPSWNFVMNLTNGNIGIGVPAPSQKLHVSGNGLFTGTVTASCGVLICSDIRYKTNIRPLTNSLTNVLTLQGIFYDWKKESFPEKQFDDKTQIGFAAQELEKIYPEMVHTDEEGFKTVDYSRLTPVLVEAIKEQQLQIDTLTSELNQLKEMIITMSKNGNQYVSKQ